MESQLGRKAEPGVTLPVGSRLSEQKDPPAPLADWKRDMGVGGGELTTDRLHLASDDHRADEAISVERDGR